MGLRRKVDLIRMKLNKTLFFLYCLTNLVAFGQGNLSGRIVDLYGENNVHSIYLKPSHTDTIKLIQMSDSLGQFRFENVKNGKYTVIVNYAFSVAYHFEHTIDGNHNDELVLEVPICKIINKNGICPKCHNKDMVYRIAPNGFFDIWFKKKSDERRYYRKVNRQGYDLTDEENGEIIWIKDLDNKIFTDVCDHWFCIRDKTIF